MRELPRDEGVTAETDPEPMRWTFDDAQVAMKLGWGLFGTGGGHRIPYIAQTAKFNVGTTYTAMKSVDDLSYTYAQNTTFEESAAAIKRFADKGVYVAQKALCILAAQKLCGL